MLPVFYDYQNVSNSVINPSTVHVHDTGLAFFFKRYLLQKAMYPIKFEAPKFWNMDYFRAVLYTFGFISVFNTDKFGVIPQQCALKGYDIFYAPTNCVISNPLLTGILEPRIGVQCILLKLTPDYAGIWDLVDYYGDLMALGAESIGVNLLNSKIAYVFAAKNKQMAESMKKLNDTIASGEPAAFVDKQLFNDDGSPNWQLFQNNVRNTYIASDLISDLRKIEAEFDTKIGIPNANTDKKERLISDEINSNNTETKALVEQWMESLQKGAEEVRNMFGIQFSVDWRADYAEYFKPTGNVPVQT